ncbi:chromosome maintenance protein [Babesia caballi]|uniref:Chromosome maintenance protein n=1 Tax=Babesia caballi TaxID=5871 RepID=A0AAV4LZS7_BABCB|nr:chromosome maintenance protein [Babesia caballi]
MQIAAAGIGAVWLISHVVTRAVRCETSSAILSFLQTQEAKLKDKLAQPEAEEDESKAEPTWLDEEDRLAEYESSQAERANDMTMKAIQKRRAANVLRSYAEGIHAELEKLKAQPGDHAEQELKLTTQLEANLARVALLHKQAELMRHQAALAKENLSTIHAAADRGSLIVRDCNMLKIGPLFYSARSDDVDHKDSVPLMAKLNGNALVLYQEKVPQLTFYLVDVELPTRPVENAPSCFVFTYRGAEQALCAGTEISCHTWMNALTEAWFCKHQGIKGTMVNMRKHKDKNGKDDKDKKKNNDTLMKHAVKENPNKVSRTLVARGKAASQGLVNMEVYVDDKNKTHMLVNGKERPVTATGNLINIQEVMKQIKQQKK